MNSQEAIGQEHSIREGTNMQVTGISSTKKRATTVDIEKKRLYFYDFETPEEYKHFVALREEVHQEDYQWKNRLVGKKRITDDVINKFFSLCFRDYEWFYEPTMAHKKAALLAWDKANDNTV